MSHLQAQGELRRIREEYTRRDRDGDTRIYDVANPPFRYHMAEREAAILSLFAAARVSLKGCHVLEVGCGDGHIIERFLDFGAERSAGLELMWNRVREGSLLRPALLLVQGDGARSPFRDGAFDLVMQFMCLSSVLDRSMRESIAREMWRVLKPGGFLLSYDLRPPSVILTFILRAGMRVFRLFRKQNRKAPGCPVTPIHLLDKAELSGLFPLSQGVYRSVSLDFNLARIARFSTIAASVLSRFPFLRTHYLALFRKDPS